MVNLTEAIAAITTNVSVAPDKVADWQSPSLHFNKVSKKVLYELISLY